MKYSEVLGEKISRLGFGCMRFPTVDGKIDKDHVQKMFDYAISHGVNYFDTAFPYHDGESENVVRECLKKYPRESYYLADKMPGHQYKGMFDYKSIFEEELKKCGTDYFDFYLLHNVQEYSMPVYMSDEIGLVDYLYEQKKLGRIKHLGFSSHATPGVLRQFLEKYGDKMEFCQIQLNYLDWTLQEAEEKYKILEEYGLPIWTMESARGGALAKLSPAEEKKLKTLRPDESIASWAFRWLMKLDQVKLSLSGMSDFSHVVDNISTYENDKPLSDAEWALLLDIAESLKDGVPCTKCRYCVKGCSMGLDIPYLIAEYNDAKAKATNTSALFTPAMHISVLPEDKRPSACIECGACKETCPQHINVPEVMKDFAELIKTLPDWEKICEERNRKAAENK